MTSGTGNWSYSTTFDCDGVASGTQLQSYMGVTRRAAAPGFCFSNDDDIKKAMNKCCSSSCSGASPIDVSTAAGQSQCLVDYGGFSSSYACVAGSGKSAVFPTYCNGSYAYSTNAMYVRATDTLCCPDTCHWTPEDLKTSEGENKCLNLESSGWTNWDCNGLSGRSAAVPSYCKTTNSNYKRAVPDNCCKDECAELAAAQTKSETEAQCLQSSGSSNWTYTSTFDCDGIESGTKLASYTGYSRTAAAPGFCVSADADIKAAVNKCCPDSCKGINSKDDLPFDLDTAAGQSQCLVEYGGFSTSYACRAGGGKSAVWPTYCNHSYKYSSNVKYVRAADTLCCPEDCTPTVDDLLTSYGENKCLNLESSGWTNWDCNVLEGGLQLFQAIARLPIPTTKEQFLIIVAKMSATFWQQQRTKVRPKLSV